MALGEIFQIIIVFALFLFVFGIICVNYFKGSLYRCVNNSSLLDDFSSSSVSLHQFLIISDKWDCINNGLEWKNSYLNFDDIVQSMSTLFIISNSISWSEIMYQASKSRGQDMTPNLYGGLSVIPILFFIAIVIIGNFFISNLFIGVIIAKFNREQELFGKNFMLTD